ncbi:MAG TPA: AfsR/SARP family transcriptional regulator [Pilimelia sp.]|nr:AfsR/SARP family transcriptional regulator [Pilimelia sp.]
MDVQLLGGPRLSMADRSAVVASRQVGRVLTMLALATGRVVSTDQLIDELWGERRMTNPRNALQANVARLRKVCEAVADRPGDAVVRTSPTGYLLDIPVESVDVCRFLALADRAAGFVHSAPGAAVELLDRAMAVWPDLHLLPPGEGTRAELAWAHLRERWLGAYEDLMSAKLAVGGDRVPIPELRQMVAAHGERERLSELLMLALYREGRQAEALEVFHRVRRWLTGELGLEPGRGLHRVYRAILAQDALIGEPHAACPAAGLGSV